MRQALLNAITPDDLRKIMTKLIQQAQRGEAWVVKELLDRTIGKAPLYADLELAEKVEALERAIEQYRLRER